MPAAKKVVRRGRGRLDRDAQLKREQAIIADLKAGEMSYREIAQKHGVSLPTVNAKARKAGIRRPRGRRRVVAAGTQAQAAPRRPGRPRKAEAAAPRRGRRRGRPRGARRGPGRPPGRRPGRPRAATGRRPGRPSKASGFVDAFRKMVLDYFPNLTLAKYDRLVRIVQAETGA